MFISPSFIPLSFYGKLLLNQTSHSIKKGKISDTELHHDSSSQWRCSKAFFLFGCINVPLTLT